MHLCFVCGKKVKSDDDYEWFGLDGDMIHTRCKPYIGVKMSEINNMTDEQFYKYITEQED